MRSQVLVLMVALAAAPAVAWGDAAADLRAGQEALAAGEVTKALPLLESAAQALPQSVEAQFDLGRAYLLTGQLEKALKQFSAVLRLSPEHAQAKAMVEGLTGQRKTFEEKLAYVRALLDLGLYSQARAAAKDLVAGPYEPAQRLAARMALAEAVLWADFSASGLPEILQTVQEAKGTSSEGPARVMAALALVASSKVEDHQSAREMLAQVGDLKPPYARWAEAARTLLDLSPANAAEVSATLLEPFLLPAGGYRQGHTDRLVRDLLRLAQAAAEQGDTAQALKIVWPMLSKAPMPTAQVLGATSRPAGQAIDFKTGWLRLAEAKSPPHLEPILATLAGIAQAELRQEGPRAALVGYLVAAEVLRQAGGQDVDARRSALSRWVALAGELGGLSRPAPDRKKGAVLSRGDEIQRVWIDQLAAAIVDEPLRDQLVAVIVGQIDRYERADDLETGLAQFVRVEKDGDAVTVRPALPAGAASVKLANQLATKFAQLAQDEVAKAGWKATLTGYRASAALLRQMLGPDVEARKPVLARWLNLAAELGALSRPAPERKKGAVLSRADEIQRVWIDQLVATIADEPLRDQLVAAIVGQIDRYERADDLETGLARFVRVEKDGDAVTVTPALPPGPASQKLLGVLASKHAQTGQAEVAREGWRATYLAHRVAAALLRQMMVQDAPVRRTAVVQFGALAAELGNLSRPAPDRKKGAVLSRADELQRAWIDELAALVADEGLRDHVVGLISGQIDRYERADDLETGLAQFVRVEKDGDAVTVRPALPAGAASLKLANHLASKFAQLAQDEVAKAGWKATLTGYRVAAALLRQMLGPDVEARKPIVGRWLNLAAELGALSRPAPDRRKGAPLSTADQLQRAWIDELAGFVADEPQRAQLVDVVVAHVERHEKAGDLETGLRLFVTAGQGPEQAVVVAPSLATGAAKQKLLAYFATKCAQAGQKAFAEAAATLDPDANKALNAWDQAAIVLSADLDSQFPMAAGGRATAQSVMERYAGAAKWEAALSAATTYYAVLEGSAGKWGIIALRLRQAIADEDRLLATNRRLDAELSPLVKAALAETRSLLTANLDEATRDRVVALADPLVWRYVGLDRYDLAAAVIDTVSPTTTEPVFTGPAARVWLTEWPIWMKALLAERQGDAALAAAARQFDGVGKLTLDAEHKRALDLHNQLITKNPQSPVQDGRVERLLAIAMRYRQYKAFDVAVAILDDFIKAHPNLTVTERVAFTRIQVLLEKAQIAFADRPEKEKAPPALSAEYAAAVEAIAAFLGVPPTEAYSLNAQQLAVEVARTYGGAGAWNVARDVLARLAKAVPNFRRPERLRFLEAATYLGELDRGHGVGLLKPPQPVPAAPATRLSAALDKVDELLVMTNGGRGPVTGPAPAPPPAAEPTPTARPVTSPAAPGQPEGRVSGRFDRDMLDVSQPADSAGRSLALQQIRQSEQQQAVRIARLEGDQRAAQGGQQAPQQATVVLPGGPVLSEAEMKRQDAAADAAYAILIDLIKDPKTAGDSVAAEARSEVLWLIGFFEGQRRHDRAVALIGRFLTDRPADPERVALAYQALGDRLAWAGRREADEKIDQAWVDRRHSLFEDARKAIAGFLADYAAKKDWTNQAHLLAVTSYQKEAMLVAAVSAARAGGLWARSAAELAALSRTVPDHPEAGQFPRRLWGIAEQLTTLRQREQALHVLSQIPIRFPTDELATQAILQMAGLSAADLAAPLAAVETYQEYMSLAGETEAIRAQVFSIAQQLAGAKRFVEALHVYGVFVDSFPTDARAPEALLAVGRTHQDNQAWSDAVAAYERLLAEYKGAGQVPPARLAIAECRINLSEWRAARRLYEDYLQEYPSDGQAQLARDRIEVLKNLDRYQTLLADPQVTRNKDDAQFQIARIVEERLGNHVKAVAEFRKVIEVYPKSHLADDAQMEVGKALLALERLEEARAELLKVALDYPTSPLADNALYLVGQSYERQAERLAQVTLAGARLAAFEGGQRRAYQLFNVRQFQQQKDLADERDRLRKEGKGKELELTEAYGAFRNYAANEDLSNWLRVAEQEAETESALQVANRQDRINEAYRHAVGAYARAAADYPLGDATDESLLQMAQIHELKLKDRQAAMETYQKVVKFFPGTPVAEDAAWKVATFYDQEGQYDEAVIAYRDFIRNYPASKRVADAQYAMAEALEKLGRWVEAMDAYQTFRDKFASHPAAEDAKERQMWIKAYRM